MNHSRYVSWDRHRKREAIENPDTIFSRRDRSRRAPGCVADLQAAASIAARQLFKTDQLGCAVEDTETDLTLVAVRDFRHLLASRVKLQAVAILGEPQRHGVLCPVVVELEVSVLAAAVRQIHGLRSGSAPQREARIAAVGVVSHLHNLLVAAHDLDPPATSRLF